LQKSKFKQLFLISNRYKLNFKRPSGMLLSNYQKQINTPKGTL